MKIWLGKKQTGILLLAVLASATLIPIPSAESVPVPEHKPGKVSGRQGLPDKAKKSFLGLALGNEKLSDKYGAIAIGGKLFKEDAGLYKKIFDLQNEGKISDANKEIAKLTDKSLMGHVLYQRYMHPVAYRSSYEELKNWLALYADQPGAEDIYKLAMVRRPKTEIAPLKKPRTGKILSQIKNPAIQYAKIYVSTKQRSGAEEKEMKNVSRKVRALVQAGQLQEAINLLEQENILALMDDVEHDRLQGKVAAGYFYAGDNDSALKLAKKSADRSGNKAALAAWIGGLAAWKTEDFKTAAHYFELTGRSEYASGWLAASGAYWAARCHEKLGSKSKKEEWLTHAAAHPRTFYGMLAVKSLGWKYDFNWAEPKFTSEHADAIAKTKSGRRALALIAAGQGDLAQEELLRLNYTGNPKLRQAALTLAADAKLPDLGMRLGNMMRLPDGKLYDVALYPLSPWQPKNGYKVDPALVHAVIRQESKFNVSAKSQSGAMGLMQLMPETAGYVMQDKSFTKDSGKQRLSQPDLNMQIGQDYLEYLLNGRHVNGDVISLLVAYNAGPGNLERWKKTTDAQNDPLLFIEMIPVQETRDYVEHVLSNYWIYSLRAGNEDPTMAALIKGKTARYAYLDKDRSLQLALK